MTETLTIELLLLLLLFLHGYQYGGNKAMYNSVTVLFKKTKILFASSNSCAASKK